jgi:ParB-like chromosome segregation protein Spo0J
MTKTARKCPVCQSAVWPEGKEPILPEGVHWHGPASLIPLLVPVESINRWPGNPRQGDVGAISLSLRRFGQQKSIVVQESSRNGAAGNHLRDAALALNWTHIAATISPLDDREAEAYVIADNRTAELGSYDEDLLGELLGKLAREGNLSATGYDKSDVDTFLRDLERRDTKVKAEIEFATELLEAHNYVVLVFDNELDWNSACTKLGIETVKAPDATETYDRRGVGRIVRGPAVISRLPD